MKLLTTVAFSIAVCALVACQAVKPTEILSYTTTNVPGNFGVAGSRLPSSFPVTLSGKLWLPEGDGLFPVVMWGHPSTRGSSALADWRRSLRIALAAEGIGIFFADSYTGRGLLRRNTASGLNSESRYLDGARALAALAAHPGIDPQRIGISGASYGANVAMRLQWESYMALVQPGGLRYAAHVPIYPPCSAIIEDYRSTGAPMLILIGEKDYNDATRCEDRAAELRKAGARVELVIYPGAHHGFLASFPPRMVDTPVYTDCGTRTLDRKKGYAVRSLGPRQLVDCVRPRGMVGGNSAARADALRRTVAFFAEHLRH